MVRGFRKNAFSIGFGARHCHRWRLARKSSCIAMLEAFKQSEQPKVLSPQPLINLYR